MLAALLLPLVACAAPQDPAPEAEPEAPEAAAPAVVRIRLGAPAAVGVVQGEVVEVPEGDESEAEDAPAEAADPGPDGGLRVTVESTRREVLTGHLTPGDAGALLLHLPRFVEPLRVDPADWMTITLDDQLGVQDGSDDLFALELLDGDRLHLHLTGSEDGAWLGHAVGHGPLAVARERVRSFERLSGGGLVHNGPSGHFGWEKDKGERFRFQDDALVASQARARLTADFGLDQERDLDLELGWNRLPRFRLVLGHGLGRLRKEAPVVEVWGETLVAWQPGGEGDAQVLELVHGLQPQGSLALRILTRADRLEFQEPDGTPLGTLACKPGLGSELSLQLDGGDLELRRLRVSHPGYAGATSLAAAEVLGFDAEEGFRTAEGAVPAGGVMRLELEPRPAPEREPDAGRVVLEYADGRRVSGRVLAFTEGGVRLQPSWSDAPLECSFQGLERLQHPERSYQRVRGGAAVAGFGKETLEGEVVGIDEAGRLRWRTTLSEDPLTLVPDELDRVQVNPKSSFFAPKRTFPHAILLRNGDRFRCRLTSVDADAVHFVTPHVEQGSLSTDRVKAVAFDARTLEKLLERLEASRPKEDDNNMRVVFGNPVPRNRESSEGLDTRSLERALALPRRYKRRGFEHLVLARNGDFLRTTAEAWDEEGLRYPGLQGTQRRIPTDRLAALVWLDADPEEGGAPSPARVVLDDENSLAVELRAVDGEELHVTSVALGELTLPLRHVTALEFGAERVHPEGPLDAWVLKPMREPFPDQEPGAGDGPQVGQPAPETRGRDLTGQQLDLASYRGQVVLLDFWGHWCGVCMARLPDKLELVEAMEGRPFTALGVNTDAPAANLLLRTRERGIHWRSFAEGGTSGPLARAWGVTEYPTTFLIDHEGVVRGIDLPHEELLEELERLLAEAEGR